MITEFVKAGEYCSKRTVSEAPNFPHNSVIISVFNTELLMSTKIKTNSSGRNQKMFHCKIIDAIEKITFAFRIYTTFFVCASVVFKLDAIKIERDKNYPSEEFKVYWNVPTFICQAYGIDFSERLRVYNIIYNENDTFRGDNMVTLYEPGDFPATIYVKKNMTYVKRNGGIPQEGNLTEHLEKFKKVVEAIVSPNAKGPAVIDFELWRPIFRQNWNEQTIHKNLSIELERKLHPNKTDKELWNLAQESFEKSAREFMEQTLGIAKTLRPNALWGYYGFPYCYNFRVTDSPYCVDMVLAENDRLRWLFNGSDALYPSIYMNSKLSTKKQTDFIIGRMNEVWRMAKREDKMEFAQSYPFVWFRYYDKDTLLSKNDMETAIETPSKYEMGGVIIWGSSSDVNSKEKCQKLIKYLNSTLGPILLRVQNKDGVCNHKSAKILSNGGEPLSGDPVSM